MSRQEKAARAAELLRLQSLANLVAVTLGAALLARAGEQAALLRQCAATADGIASELAELSGGAS